MKILYHHRIASKDGQYVHIDELITALKDLGHEIIMAEPESIEHKVFGTSSNSVKLIRQFLPGFLHESVEFAYALLDFSKLLPLLLKHKPDVIYERYNLFFPSGIWAKKLFKIPLLLEVNAPLYEERKKHDGIQLDWLARWTENYVWKQADYVLPVTRVLAEKIIVVGVSERNITVIPNGINQRRFGKAIDSTDVIEKYQLKNKLVLGFTGFVRDWHRLDRVLEAIADNRGRNWHLLLVGDGPARAAIEQQAQSLGISDRLTITGIIDRDEVARYVAVFDVALQPDVVEYASPLKLFEYMALGKAILAPDRANIREILTHRTDALLFDPENDLAFGELLCELCFDDKLRSQLGTAAAQTLDGKKLYWQENAKRIENLLK
ncbi:MAG: glycosyltransferase family 4 protein [Methylovulum sp.]|uniref:glycosyltransferase family 4 protein n=1 Tax=Methylovulum sp. TaxID=1916980 RepID=UPI0026025F92|nr:glycosyltransferase family 4 protein [Methylovulum sp.]MDD2725339.1 glycosyltransferase family 4 protein [Methylovulum sp.]MDD5124836.1 glycosyltransferase family 4 protein [Methylovulum sp.]